MKRAVLGVLLTLAGPAAAQDAGWRFGVSAYGWLPAISTDAGTPFGTVTTDKSTSDVISDLDFAFMGTVEAQRDRWTLIGDAIYVDLGATRDTPFGRRFSDARVDVRVTTFSGYALYRVTENPRVAVDLGGGFRAFGMDLDVSLRPGETNDDGFDRDSSETWVDPLVAARVIAPFSEKWFGTAFADLGGTASDDNTWQAFVSVGYRFSDRWSTQAGYRYMRIEKDIDGADSTVDLYGPLIGFTARF